MIKTLKFINKEDEKSYNEDGSIKSAVEKSYFNYICHEPDAECQLQPVVCRIHDKMQPGNEAVWKADETACSKCFGSNNRLLEDIYRS